METRQTVNGKCMASHRIVSHTHKHSKHIHKSMRCRHTDQERIKERKEIYRKTPRKNEAWNINIPNLLRNIRAQSLVCIACAVCTLCLPSPPADFTMYLAATFFRCCFVWRV